MLAKAGISCLSKSFIQLQATGASLPKIKPSTHLFFSSPRSVNLFFDTYQISDDVKLAAISEGTAMAIKQKIGRDANFIGDGAEMKKTCENFTEYLSKIDTVIFPIGQFSKQSIQKKLPSKINWINFEFYTTVIQDKNTIIKNFDAYFISSPSQFKALKINKLIMKNSSLFCFKGSTSVCLEQDGLQKIVITNFTRKQVYEQIYAHLSR